MQMAYQMHKSFDIDKNNIQRWGVTFCINTNTMTNYYMFVMEDVMKCVILILACCKMIYYIMIYIYKK